MSSKTGGTTARSVVFTEKCFQTLRILLSLVFGSGGAVEQSILYNLRAGNTDAEGCREPPFCLAEGRKTG